jgi:hypothetical protein
MITFSWGQSTQVNLSDYNKPGTILFSTVPAPRSGALLWDVSVRFAETDSIHACAFFPYKFGSLGKDEHGCLDVRIDGIFLKRYYFDNRDVPPSYSHVRLYIFKTGKDDVDASFFSALSKGEHRVLLTVGIEGKRAEGIAGFRSLAEGFFLFVR